MDRKHCWAPQAMWGEGQPFGLTQLKALISHAWRFRMGFVCFTVMDRIRTRVQLGVRLLAQWLGLEQNQLSCTLQTSCSLLLLYHFSV